MTLEEAIKHVEENCQCEVFTGKVNGNDYLELHTPSCVTYPKLVYLKFLLGKWDYSLDRITSVDDELVMSYVKGDEEFL